MNSEKAVVLRMLEEIREAGFADRETLALKIRDEFGDECVKQSEHGNGEISFTRQVMIEFNKQKGSDIFWARRERGWRTKDANDR